MNRQKSKYYIDGILCGDRYILSKAISLMESDLSSDKQLSSEVLKKLGSKTGNAIRLGVTGVPGVGKSTFIEAFGEYLISLGKKVAVLAVDPSSERTGGSILGDKTRMSSLSINDNAFIRPSPTKNTLGGVSNSTRENILLCEVAGYDVIIVETVGVGQSETHVRNMVDFFLLMMLPGAGDELQGIKKGIMEMADGLIINKADGSNLIHAKQAKADYKNALHMFSPSESGWIPKVELCSSLEITGIDEVWKMIVDHRKLLAQKELLSKIRGSQNIDWFREQISKSLVDQFLADKKNMVLKNDLEERIQRGELLPREALSQLMERFFDKR